MSSKKYPIPKRRKKRKRNDNAGIYIKKRGVSPGEEKKLGARPYEKKKEEGRENRKGALSLHQGRKMAEPGKEEREGDAPSLGGVN